MAPPALLRASRAPLGQMHTRRPTPRGLRWPSRRAFAYGPPPSSSDGTSLTRALCAWFGARAVARRPTQRSCRGHRARSFGAHSKRARAAPVFSPRVCAPPGADEDRHGGGGWCRARGCRRALPLSRPSPRLPAARQSRAARRVSPGRAVARRRGSCRPSHGRAAHRSGAAQQQRPARSIAYSRLSASIHRRSLRTPTRDATWSAQCR